MRFTDVCALKTRVFALKNVKIFSHISLKIHVFTDYALQFIPINLCKTVNEALLLMLKITRTQLFQTAKSCHLVIRLIHANNHPISMMNIYF